MDKGAEKMAHIVWTDLMDAAFNNDSLKIRQILTSSKCDIDEHGAMNNTALHWAASMGNLDAVCELIRNKCSLDVAGVKKKTPLHLAVTDGHLEVVRKLIEHECNINAVDEDGQTALHVAAGRGFFEIVAELIKQQCEVNYVTEDGKTALMFAAQEGHRDIVALLVKQPQCQVNLQEYESNMTALHIAARHARTDILSLLLDCPKVDTSIIDTYGDTLLRGTILSATANSLQCSRSTYNMVKKIKETTWFRIDSPTFLLTEIVDLSCVEMVKFLLENGADPNNKSHVDEPALHIAIRIDSYAKCHLLLRYGASIDVKFDGLNALEYAVTHFAKPSIIELLLSYAVEPVDFKRLIELSQIKGRKEPLLCLATSLGVTSFLKALKDTGSVEETDFSGLSAIDVACKHRNLCAFLCDEFLIDTTRFENSEMTKWYRLCSKFSCIISPSSIEEFNKNVKRISCSELYEQATNFRLETQEVQEIREAALCMLTDASEVISKSSNKHLKFKPILQGSTNEGTKINLPDELDIVCVLTECDTLTLEESELTETHRWVRTVKESPFFVYCFEEDDATDGLIDAKKFTQEFYASLIPSLKANIAKCYGKNGHLFLPKYFFEKHEKISNIKVIWRGSFFKDLVVKIDVVPAFPFNDVYLDRPVPLGEKGKFYLVPKFTGLIACDVDIPISFSDKEGAMFKSLPYNIKEGYVLAKICRDVRVCFPNEPFPIDEPIRVDDLLTSYRLKTSLMFIIETYKREEILNDNNFKEEWAKKIYEQFILFLVKGYVPSFHEPESVNCHTFQCRHPFETAIEDRVDCCQKRHIMIALCKQIIAFLDKEIKIIRRNTFDSKTMAPRVRRQVLKLLSKI